MSAITTRATDVARDHLRRAREHLVRGLLEDSRARVEDALALARKHGDRELVAECLAEWGHIDLRSGRLAEAEARLRAAQSLGEWNAGTASALAEVRALNGHVGEGYAQLVAALQKLVRDEDAEDRAVVLCRLCRVCASRGDLQQAVSALTDAQTLHLLGPAHTLRVTRELSASAEAIERARAWQETQAQA